MTTIAAAWSLFEAQCVPKAYTPEERAAARMCFYAGFMAAFGSECPEAIAIEAVAQAAITKAEIA